MSLSPDLDPKVRFIVLYRDAQMKVSRIAKLLKLSESTAYDWKNKFDKGIDIFQHQSKNSSAKIDSRTRYEICREAVRSPKPASSRKLGAKYGVSHTTVCGLLRDKGLRYVKEDKEHILTPEEMTIRVDYCRDMLKSNGSKLKRTFFSDEMGIKLSEMNNRGRSWGPKPKKKVKTDVKLNCWGAISYNGATSLHIFTGNLNNDIYQDIIEEHAEEMQDIYGNKKIFFQQDNHPAHGNVSVLDDFPKIDLLNFPTYSPDLNPIENIWSTLKYRVASDAPGSEKAMIKSLRNNWEQLTQPENLRPYIETLYGRYDECLEQEGGRLPY